MKNNILSFLSIAIIVSAISCNRPSTQMIVEDESLPFNIDCSQYSHTPKQGTDSRIGTITCDDITLNYDYGKYSFAGPSTHYENFVKSFYAVRYSQFFEAILVQEKVREILKDSVQIISAEKGRIQDKKYIVDCKECDATATLIFNKIEYYYGFIMNKKLEKEHFSYSISIEDTDQEYYKKTYYNVADGSQGILIAPTGNPAKNRKKNKLSVTSWDTQSDRLKRKLKSISLR